MVWNYHNLSVVVVDADLKMKNTSMNKQPLIAKRFFSSKGDKIEIRYYHSLCGKIAISPRI